MCAIIGWSGLLPKGLLTKMLHEAESRGRDSTGIAFRTEGKNLGYRQAVPADTFIRINGGYMSQARRSLSGLAHTRRASPGMPINDENAHPFAYGRYFFAHNGRIRNWPAVKETLTQRYEAALEIAKQADPTSDKVKSFEYTINYVKNATTDSMVLGPYIAERNFEEIVGCMGLVWMKSDEVYVMHSAKELTAANVIWKNKKGDDRSDNLVTIAASTPGIIAEAFAQICNDVEFEYDFKTMTENHIYKLTAAGIVDEGAVPVNPANDEDAFTSSLAETPVEAAAAAPETPVPSEPTPVPDTLAEAEKQSIVTEQTNPSDADAQFHI